MSPVNAVIWMFLGIFLATAVLTLASLPGWLAIKETYRKKLFNLLILEVIGCTVAFGQQALRNYRAAPQQDIGTVMLSQERYGWDWQYSQKNWRSRFLFERTDKNHLKMIGTTSVVKEGANDVPILKWETKDAFQVNADQKSVTFDAQRTWLNGAAEVYPELKWEVGKTTPVTINFQVGWALEGSATDGAGPQWGIMLTSGFPR